MEFNRAVMGCVQATLEALNDCNRTMAALSARIGSEDTVQQMNDIRMHWSHWRVEWEKKLAGSEITFLKGVPLNMVISGDSQNFQCRSWNQKYGS